MIGLNTESLAQVGDDWVLDVEVTTNRPDCLSHYGVGAGTCHALSPSH